MKVRIVIAVVVLLLFGALRLPFEEDLSRQLSENHFGKGKLDLDMRERLGQTAFLAALSGFRSVVADIVWLQVYTSFENTHWGTMNLQLDTTTTLQPRNILFWDNASWHMAYNASASAAYDPKQPREALRRKAQLEYFDIGRDFLERGIENNPDRPDLYVALGNLLRDKFEDPCKAAQAYAKGAEFPNAMGYVKRFAAYELARCEGSEKEAYAKLKALYDLGPEERKPTLLTLIHDLEEKLGIPSEQSIVKPDQKGL